MNRSIAQHIAFLLLFIIVGSLIYSNTLEVPFYFDDQIRIHHNPHVRITKLNSKEILSAAFNEKSSKNRPIGNITFALNYYFHQYRLTGYHLVNIIVHLLTVILLYFFIKTTLSLPALASKYDHPDLIAFFATLVWLVHPVHTQSVTYIVQRLNSMAAMFYMFSFLLYIKGRLVKENRNRWIFFACSALAWILALGSKENAAMLPLFVFLYEWYFFQNLDRSWLKRHLKYIFGVFIFLSIVAFLFLGTNPVEKLKSIRDFALHEFTLKERILTQFRVVLYYLSLLVYPHPSRLNLDYDFPLSHSLIDPVTTLLSLGIILGFIGLAVYTARKEHLLSFCILWFFGNLVIESSVIPLAIIFEHRTYLPSMLVLLLPVTLGLRLIKLKWLAYAAMCTLIAVFSLWTYQRNNIWRDPVALWSDCVKKSPQKARPHNNLGLALADQDRKSEAISYYTKALLIDPNYWKAHNNMGLVLAELTRTSKAVRHYSEALRINPNNAEVHNNLGNALVDQGRTAEAIGYYSKALQLNPNFEAAHYNLGNTLITQHGPTEEAIDHFVTALLLKPRYVDAYNSLGAALIQMGKIDEAIVHLQKALQIEPDSADTHITLGIALLGKGGIEDAIAHFRKALRIKPYAPEIHVNLGTALINMGKIEPAVAHFREALRIEPGHAEAQNNLKRAEAILKELNTAIANLEADLDYNPEDPDLHYNLGILYHRKGNLNAARDAYQQALSIEPEFIEALNNLALVYMLKKGNDKAIVLFNKLTALQPDNAGHYYNLACIYSRQNQVGESIDRLKKAVEKGYHNWDLIKTDKDLANIRSSSYYKGLVKGH